MIKLHCATIPAMGPKSILALVLALAIGAGIYEYYVTRNSPDVQARALSQRILQEQGAEYDRLAAKRHKREMDAYEQKHGRAARSRREDAYGRGYWGPGYPRVNSTNLAQTTQPDPANAGK